MSGIFTILSDAQTGLFRMKQARRAADIALDGPKDARQQLTDKADQAAPSFSLSSDRLREANTAMAALEQARRIGNPKAHAEERLQDAERRIRDLRAEMRMAAARGDRDKMMKLAREAAVLARQVGRAAKDYGSGMAAAADMGLGGGAGLNVTSSETTVSTSVTTIRAVQVDVNLQVTVTGQGGEQGSGASSPAMAIPAPPPPPPAPALLPQTASSDDASEETPGEEGAGEPASDLQATIQSALDALGAGQSGEGEAAARAATPFQAQFNSNQLRMSRYREADTFARRVETVLAAIKNVLGEAKVANTSDTDHQRRKDRREELKEYDKEVEGAEKAVRDLRSAAFGTPADASAIAPADATGGSAATSVPVTTVPAAVNLLA